MLLSMPDGQPFFAEVVVAAGETVAALHLRTDQQVTIGAWSAVSWELRPEGRGRQVPFEIEATRPVEGGSHESFMFDGMAPNGWARDFVIPLVRHDGKIRVSVRLPKRHQVPVRVSLTLHGIIW